MAKQPKTLGEIIEYAIAKERVAQAIYSNAAKEATRPGNQRLLRDMAEAEANHEKTLQNLDLSNIPEASPDMIEDLRIAEFLEDVELQPDADIQTVLIYAMKREQQSRDFYEAMASRCDDASAKKLFTALATEEQGHKRTLELIYDEEILREN